MIGLDSSVLLRYITEDDPVWSAAATRFVDERCSEESPGFVSSVVLAETVWTLRTAYGYAPDKIADVITQLLGSSSFVVADEVLVYSALTLSQEKGAGFADCLIACLNAAAGAAPTYAIDKKAVRGEIFQQLPR